jgi:hypothetical protein
MYRELENISDPFPLNKSQPLKQTTLISTFQKKTQLNSYWIKAVKGAGLGRVFVMTLQGLQRGWHLRVVYLLKSEFLCICLSLEKLINDKYFPVKEKFSLISRKVFFLF